jgi:hypothetical protein
MHQAVGVVLIIVDIQSLAADVAFCKGIIPVSTDFNDTIVLDPNLESTVIPSQYTRCFFPIHC